MSMLLQAKAELPKITAFTNDDLKKMLPEEIMARWILAFNDVYAERWKEATKLPIAQRLVKVKELQEEIDAQRKLIGLPDSPFGLFDIQLVAREFEFQRRVNFLQTIEAIRHHIATHEGQLPDSLSDLELRSPLDPLTEKPFEYSASKSIAKLRYPKALDLELPGYHSYVLKAVSPSAK